MEFRKTIASLVLTALLLTEVQMGALSVFQPLIPVSSAAGAADLSITKSASASSVLRGTTITYTVTASNAGPDTATNVVIADPIPADFLFNSGLSSPGCVQIGSNILCDSFSLNAGDSHPVSIVFDVPTISNCTPSTVSNTASVSSSITDPDSSNNQSNTVQTNVTCPPITADLSITKSASSPSVVRGSVIMYTVIASNAGPSAATNVVITDLFPAGLTFNAGMSSAGCVLNGTEVLCNNFNLSSGDTHTVQIAFDVPLVPNCSQTTIQNSAIVSTSMTDPDPSNNQSAVVQTTVTCPTMQADLSITKSGPSSIVRGSVITYTLTGSNAGPDAATNVVISDPIPVGLTFNAGMSSAGCVQNGSNILCDSFSLTSGQNHAVQIAFTIPAVANCSQTTIQNMASISSSSTDLNPGNNQSAVVQTTVMCPVLSPKLYVTKSVPALTVGGQNVTYTFTLQNTSTFTANNVYVYDYYIDATLVKIAPPFTFLSSSGLTCQFEMINNRVACAPVNLAPQQMIQFTMTFATPSSGPACNYAFTNKVEAIAGTDQQSLDTDTASTFLQCSAPQFSLSKLGPTVVSPGEELSYIITATNTGQTVQTGIQLVDDIPLGLIFQPIGSTAGCSVQTDAVVCAAQTFNPGQIISYTLKFIADSTVACGSVILNEAELKKNGVEFRYSNQTHSDVQCNNPKLDVTKSAPISVNAGGTATYTYILHNTSLTSSALAIELFDFNIDPQAHPLNPAQFTFLSSSIGHCTVDSEARVHCTLPSLSPNQTVTFTLTFAVPNTPQLCGTTVINQVDVWTQGRIADADWDKAQTIVTCPLISDLGIIKTGATSITRGNVLSYNLAVTNAGPSIVPANVRVVDAIPQGQSLTFNQGASSAGCSQSGTTIVCLGTLAPNTSTNFVVAFTVPTIQNCSVASIFNTATVTSQLTDSNLTNNTSQVATTLNCPDTGGGITVYKTDNRTTANVNDVLHYDIILTNSANTTSANLTVTDAVPYGLTILDVSDGGSISGQNVTWNNITVGANASRTIRVNARVRTDVSDRTVLHNTVSVNGQSSSDDTTINNPTYSNNPPTYYPPYQVAYQPPYYQQPYQPSYTPVAPTVFSVPAPPVTPPPIYYPPVVIPQTGTIGAGFYANAYDRSKLSPARVAAAVSDAASQSAFSSIFYLTLLTLFAAGSATATRFLIGGGL